MEKKWKRKKTETEKKNENDIVLSSKRKKRPIPPLPPFFLFFFQALLGQVQAAPVQDASGKTMRACPESRPASPARQACLQGP